MPDLAERLRDFVDTAQPSVTMDEVREAVNQHQLGDRLTPMSPRLVLVPALAVALLVAIVVPIIVIGGDSNNAGRTSGHGRQVTNPGSKNQLTTFDRQKVASAVLTANEDKILSQTTEFVSTGGQVLNAVRILVDPTSGKAVYETLSSSGSPAGALVFNDGSVINISYAKQDWWTVTTAGAGSPTLQDPEATATGVQSLVTSGQLKVTSTTELDGQPATELVGQGVLPGSTLTLWVSQVTNLPIQAIGTQSDGSKQITTYQWLDRNDQNLRLVTPAPPSGYTHLSGPPPGEVPASPLG
jgi:hypothetical protein